jgi:hypothetical protein
MITMNVFVWGATAMGSWTAGLFFLRFWWRSRDRLLLIFALAFWVLALNWTVLALTPTAATEARNYAYVIRLVAFLLLLAGIVVKNRRSG